MPLPKRLQQTVKKLSPQQLQALQALLDQLIQQKEPAHEKLPGKAAPRHYTYRREYVKCGKQGCSCAKGKGHGPYWYAYWREGKKLKKKYLGKKRTGGG
jgi:hypothetical protein